MKLTMIRSILATTWGTLINLLGTIINQSTQKKLAASMILNIGWIMMVSGFALVLYSRLHLFKPSKLLLRIALICIVVDAILFHGPILVVTTIFRVSPSPLLLEIYRYAAYTEVAFSVQVSL
jgi:hypothetical protein